MKVFSAVFILIFLFSCQDTSKIESFLDKAENIMEEHPDSAYHILNNHIEEINGLPQSVSSRFWMLLAEACNKTERSLPSDSTLSLAVEYYRRNGTSNQQMKAHYLLGCYYRDSGEAPLAIRNYEDAVDCADTLSNGCDYLTLMRIYGQMAEVFNKQLLPDEEIKANKRYSESALKAGNVYEYIRGIELQMYAYYQNNDTSMVLQLTDSVRQLYLENGMREAAASIYPSAIFIKTRNKDFGEAKRMIDVFEKESGLFDSSGNIAEDRRKYYYVKGNYYLGVQSVDSAIYMYEKAEDSGFALEAYEGLLNAYLLKNNVDSITKYIRLYENELEGHQHGLHTVATSNVTAMYNYERNYRKAELLEIKAIRMRYAAWIVAIAVILAGAVSLFYFRKYRNRKERERNSIREQYNSVVSELRRSVSDLAAAKENLMEFEKKKLEEIAHYQEILRKTGFADSTAKDIELSTSEIVERFRKKGTSFVQGESTAGEDEWNCLFEVVKKSLPVFYANLCLSKKLTSMEYKICVLSRLDFSTSDIQIILGKNHTQDISNAKKRILTKLFTDSGSQSLDSRLKEWK